MNPSDKIFISKSGIEETREPDDETLEQIGRFTLKKPDKNELFIFSAVLCDNEIDRDLERFSVSTLKKLADMYTGVTGIFDHSMSSRDQTARIYKTQMIADETRKTSIGENYTYVKAGCYMVRSEKTETLIREIENGIIKEVSVSCSVGERVCSVCGKRHASKGCRHILGEEYDGKICHAVLNSPKDVYEWSFVAVPAQRNAGVSKSAKKGGAPDTVSTVCGESGEEIITALQNAQKGAALSEAQIKSLGAFFDEMKQDASSGKEKRLREEREIIAMSAFTLPLMDTKSLSGILKKLDGEEISMLKTAFTARSHETNAFSPKLKGENEKSTGENEQFKI